MEYEKDRLIEEHGLLAKIQNEDKKPERNTIINKEDIINLQIALNTTNSLDEFLAAI